MSLFEFEENIQPDEAKKQISQNIKQTIKNKKVIEIKPELDIKPARELKEIHSFNNIFVNLIEQFKKNSMHHAIMFSGIYGIGKATFAYWLIYNLIITDCETKENADVLKKMHLEMLNRNIHPDVFFLEIQDGENEIKIEQIRNLLDKIYLKSNYGNKFVIIDDINSININGVNAILKTLEEPPANTYFFIINHKNSTLLDTIYSRCNEIKLKLSKNDCMQIIQQQHEDLTFDEIEFYSTLSSNSIKFANIMIELDIKSLIDNIKLNDNKSIAHILNVVYKNLDTKYTKFSRIIKMSILEKILMFLICQNIDNCKQEEKKFCIINNNNLLKQFNDIKSFELPVVFV